MNLNNFSLLIFFISLNAEASSAFEERANYVSGSANVAPFLGGEYVYRQAHSDERIRTAPFMSGSIERQEYVFFTAQEERALNQFRDLAMVKSAKKQSLILRQLPQKKAIVYAWPKVVIRGNEICVPDIENSESPDWKLHLICHEKKEGAQ